LPLNPPLSLPASITAWVQSSSVRSGAGGIQSLRGSRSRALSSRENAN
jgi:hypothetical protein